MKSLTNSPSSSDSTSEPASGVDDAADPTHGSVHAAPSGGAAAKIRSTGVTADDVIACIEMILVALRTPRSSNII